MLRGAVDLNDQPLATSDGVAISDASPLTISSDVAAELLLFDLA